MGSYTQHRHPLNGDGDGNGNGNDNDKRVDSGSDFDMLNLESSPLHPTISNQTSNPVPDHRNVSPPRLLDELRRRLLPDSPVEEGIYFDTCFFAVPTTVLLTFVANLKEQSVSPR